ncbi:uncharacterized protein RAG0_04443 [Rhynchosporium agropyri]|uniref:NmrA-like domain-containing protein n=1 Tax=Rhynchosporium agropyri TaxID=914238 RepID=A0A1E1KCK6_9HELO|nr:uncharacterized protein RAG0_04443 [Rhynchosporium agropyri]
MTITSGNVDWSGTEIYVHKWKSIRPECGFPGNACCTGPYEMSKSGTVCVAPGDFGPAILKEPLDFELLETSVSTRRSSNHNFSSQVKVIKVDYTDLESLTSTLVDQDTLVSAIGTLAIPSQKPLIDAAVNAGVKIKLLSISVLSSKVFSQELSQSLQPRSRPRNI